VKLAACSGNSDFTQLQTKLLDLRVLHFFVNYDLFHKYLEKRSTNAGTQANPPIVSYARSKGAL